MKTLFSVAVVAASALSFAQNISAAEMQVDADHSGVGFEIKHMMIATVNGSFREFEGTVDADDKTGALSKVNFTVKTSSIDTANKKRDEHLRGEDFFDTEKFPEAKFVSKSVKGSGKKFKVTGDLTLHGVTKEVALDVLSLGKNKDPWGNQKYGYQATATIKRKDFGLGWNKALESGGVLVGEDVKLKVDVEAAPKKAEAAN